MVGAGITNKSPVTMRNVTPIARLTEEAGVIVVPTSGKIQGWKDFEAAIKANPKAVSVAGGSAGGTDHQLLGLVSRPWVRIPVKRPMSHLLAAALLTRPLLADK